LWYVVGRAPRTASSRLPSGRSSNVLLRRLHIIELLAHFGETRFQFVYGVMQRLHLTGNLVDLAARVAGLLSQRSLQILDSRPHFVHIISLLREQVFHHAHALIERLLHA
jgi:hypothetical protein